MEILTHLINIVLHLDEHILAAIHDYGTWTYLILFVIIFCETGLVVTPFLPGDSLLFVIGAVSATGSLSVEIAIGVLFTAAVLGNTVNYWIGHFLAAKVFRPEYARILKPEYLEATQKFFNKYGGKAIIITRFVPIIRTFTPFMAGVGRMNFWRFSLYNFAGGALWVLSLVLAGFFFGNIPFIRKNLTAATFVIIFISFLPGVWEYWQHKKSVTK